MPNETINQLYEIIACCRRVEFSGLPEMIFVNEAPENAPIHGMPRLSVLLAGQENFTGCIKGELRQLCLERPGIYYCSRGGYLWGKKSPPHRALSFCYLSEYIRISWIDGSDPDPNRHSGVAIHSSKPLSPGGFALINAFETLYCQGNQAAAKRILTELWTLTLDELSESADTTPVRNPRLWNEINHYLRSNRTAALTRENTAKAFLISPGYLSRLARRYAGCDFIELITRYKLEHAAVMLRTTGFGIDEISLECGFNYRSYFDRRFKKFYGVTPREYREKNMK